MIKTTNIFSIFHNYAKHAIKSNEFFTSSCRWTKISKMRTNPSATRNSEHIAKAMRLHINEESKNITLLEIASGCGQHCGYLSNIFPGVTFQPTEYDKEMLESIKAYADHAAEKNILQPLLVDISKDYSEWNEPSLKEESFDYMLNINMMHISPLECSKGLFNAASKLLKHGGKLLTYGPYSEYGVLKPQSNIDFDMWLKERNKSWGVRDIVDLRKYAVENGMELKDMYSMPANNRFLVFVKH